MRDIRESWNGTVRLWKVFWLYGVAPLASFISVMIYAVRFGDVVEAITAILCLIWLIWLAVSLWRCAFNSNWAGWGYLTRVLEVVIVVSLLWWVTFGPCVVPNPCGGMNADAV